MKSSSCRSFGSVSLLGAVEGSRTGSPARVDCGSEVVEAKRIDGVGEKTFGLILEVRYGGGSPEL